jgi:hypothetical protein
MKKFPLYVDPGHAWVKVPMTLLVSLQIANNITRFSYRKNDHAYLEEDCDLATFVRAYRNTYNVNPQFVERCSNRDSRIRSYPSYTTR